MVEESQAPAGPGDRAGLAAIARRFRWITRIVAPDAPGFVFFGGELHPADFGLGDPAGPLVSLTGKGLAEAEAFAGCVGEGVEHLSRLEWGTEPLTRGRPGSVPHGLDEASLAAFRELLGLRRAAWPALDWMPATRLADGAPVLVPADLCLDRSGRNGGRVPPSATSTGCAAGPTPEAALLSALLELVERDAVALWWEGGRRGRAVGLETLAGAGAGPLLARLRGDRRGRATWLLDITTDLEIPCFAAVSVDSDGRGFAAGFAARLDPAEAIRAALLEMCQVELGHHLVAAKRKVRGEAALNDADRRQLRRGREIDAAACLLLHPEWPPRAIPDRGPAASPALATVVGRLRAAGIEALAVDLTRPALGVAAARALAPGLQPFPSTLTTARLRRTKGAQYGRTAGQVSVPLF